MAVGFAFALLLLLPAQQSAAHDPGFYRFWYPIGIDDVPVRFDSEFPSGRARSRITDAAQQWNRLGRRMHFRVNRSPSINADGDVPTRAGVHCPTPESGGRRQGMIHWTSLRRTYPGTLAVTGWCWKGPSSGRSIRSFRTHFDRARTWYTGTGDSRRKSKRTKQVRNFWDFWGVAVHELGHATGWNGRAVHWNGGGDYCDYLDKPDWKFRTMCPTYTAGLDRWRTLAPADKHVFRSHYGPR